MALRMERNERQDRFGTQASGATPTLWSSATPMSPTFPHRGGLLDSLWLLSKLLTKLPAKMPLLGKIVRGDGRLELHAEARAQVPACNGWVGGWVGRW